MTRLIRYEYEPAIGYQVRPGHIKGQRQGYWLLPGESPPADAPNIKPFDPIPNELVLTDYIMMSVTINYPDRPPKTVKEQLHGGGHAFVLGDDGKPEKDADGNYLIAGRSWDTKPVSVNDFILIGQLNSGVLQISDVHPDIILGLNRALSKANLPLIKGTSVLPDPTFTCTTQSAGIDIGG